MQEKTVLAVCSALQELMSKKPNVLVAIDGRCASGKTSLAQQLRQRLSCNVIHMDDFFLRPEQRTPERLRQAGENIDHERFLQEVLLPLHTGKPFYYHAFDCHTMQRKPAVIVQPKPLCIIEGSYSCHPALREQYDLRIFLTVTKQEQLRRISARNGQNAAMFIQKWVPMEESYFSALHVAECCQLCFET